MFFNILKKDLKRKKTMNFILLIFIILCTTFLASSANNMVTTLSALDYFEEKTNGADYYMFSFEKDPIEKWIQSSNLVSDYEHSEFIVINSSQIKLPTDEDFASSGTISLTKLGHTYNRILDTNNKPIAKIKPGEIALSNERAKRNNLSLGDTITIKIDDKEKDFKLTQIVKDMAFGTSYMGISKITISDEDYTYFETAQAPIYGNVFMMKITDIDRFEKDMNNQNFKLFGDFGKDIVRFCYTMDMMTATILIIVSICLILIALVVLRFSIGFTIQEDFREIGIMKAIGIRNFGIKGLYIAKYFAIAIIGSIIGVILSFPFGNILLKNIQDNVAMESTSGNLWINLICGALTVLLVVVFCYLSASKVNKFTAIQAIRNGSSGERFQHKSPLKLHKRGKMSAVFYMALNDILSSFKSFCVLIITFVLGTLLVILPINAANTLTGDECIPLFGMLKNDVYINNNRADFYCSKGEEQYIKNDVDTLKQFYHENGIDIDFYTQYMFRVKVYTEDPNESIGLFCIQSPDTDINKFTFLAGTAPKLPNEIAMTERTMEKLGVKIGDSVQIRMGETTKEFLITARYQWMMNMGDGIRFSKNASVDMKQLAGIMPFSGTLKDRTNVEAQIQKIKDLSPQYIIYNSSEYLEQYLSSIISSIESIKWMILAIVLTINCLITVLMTRTLMTKDIGQIALLKNIGFSDRAIRMWQALRIIIVLTVSIILGAILSNPLNLVMGKYTFGLMGAGSIQMNIVPWEVYLLYPLVLFIGTTITAILSTRVINKINLREVSNIE